MARLTLAHKVAAAQLIRFVFPATLVVVGLLVTNRLSSLPKWLITVTAVLSIPPYHICGAWIRYWRNARRAARMGAVLPPRWDGKLPGNWDVLDLVNRSVEEGFLSAYVYYHAWWYRPTTLHR